MLEELKERLHQRKASLIVKFTNGEIKEYYQNRIEDIKEILQNDKQSLKGASIADKVIGKVVSSILTVAGVKEIYADVMSKYTIPILEKNGIKYEYKSLVEYVQNNDKTGMCPMENKYKQENDIHKIYKEMVEGRI
ncbi:MAG: DUF1893 domain-containing protein [Clostridia bacterium]|nr:DUF1893 domain-containing protein [Clostridia bacterium]